MVFPHKDLIDELYDSIKFPSSSAANFRLYYSSTNRFVVDLKQLLRSIFTFDTSINDTIISFYGNLAEIVTKMDIFDELSNVEAFQVVLLLFGEPLSKIKHPLFSSIVFTQVILTYESALWEDVVRYTIYGTIEESNGMFFHFADSKMRYNLQKGNQGCVIINS